MLINRRSGLVVVVSLLMLSGVLSATKKEASPKEFIIYDENYCKFFIPSGWMGDVGDLKMNAKFDQNPASGKTCLRFEYSAERKQGAGWAGVYWQNPPNNWGNQRGGYDLTGYKALKFKVRGEKGGEVIDKFGWGGITGDREEGDSDQESITSVTLTKEWKEIEIDMFGRDLSHIIGGFFWAANADLNPNGFVMFLDDIRFVK